MPVPIKCPHCDKAFGADPAHAGRQVACPHCTGAVTLPSAMAAAQSSSQPPSRSPTKHGRQGFPIWLWPIVGVGALVPVLILLGILSRSEPNGDVVKADFPRQPRVNQTDRFREGTPNSAESPPSSASVEHLPSSTGGSPSPGSAGSSRSPRDSNVPAQTPTAILATNPIRRIDDLPDGNSFPISLLLSPDGRLLFCESEKRGSWLFDSSTLQPIKVSPERLDSLFNTDLLHRAIASHSEKLAGHGYPKPTIEQKRQQFVSTLRGRVAKEKSLLEDHEIEGGLLGNLRDRPPTKRFLGASDGFNKAGTLLATNAPFGGRLLGTWSGYGDGTAMWKVSDEKIRLLNILAGGVQLSSDRDCLFSYRYEMQTGVLYFATWSNDTGQLACPKTRLMGNWRGTRAVAYNVQSGILAAIVPRTGDYVERVSLVAWNAKTGEQLAEIPFRGKTYDRSGWHIILSRSGGVLAALNAEASELWLFRTDDWKQIREVTPLRESFELAPNGETFAAKGVTDRGEPCFGVWDINTGVQRSTFQAIGDNGWCSFTADGNALICISGDRSGRVLIDLWRLSDGKLLRRWAKSSVLRIAVSDDASLIATSASYHGGLATWDFTKGVSLPPAFENVSVFKDVHWVRTTAGEEHWKRNVIDNVTRRSFDALAIGMDERSIKWTIGGHYLKHSTTGKVCPIWDLGTEVGKSIRYELPADGGARAIIETTRGVIVKKEWQE